jgi:signal transduction histidine kinase
MRTSLRRRILLLLAPLLLVVTVQGGASIWLLQNLGGRIDLILSENYVSVQAMQKMSEALERIDNSFQFALFGREAEAHKEYKDSWHEVEKQHDIEGKNLTIFPEEPRLFEVLGKRKKKYRDLGDQFYQLPAGHADRRGLYYETDGKPGPLPRALREMKDTAMAILRLNQDNMERASEEAKRVARSSAIGMTIGLGLALALAGALLWLLVPSLLRPIEAITRAAQAIGEGQLHRTVPVIGHDELAQLARTFNTMTQRLRDYRQSNSERLLRTQQTSQATIDSFPDPVLVIDPLGRVELANPAARRVLGVAPRTETGSALPWQPPDPLQKPLAEALKQQKPHLSTSFDQAITLRLEGGDHAFLPQVSPIRDPYGGVLGAAVVLNDVTRFRLLDQLKTDLVSTVSHELKTPLTGIRLALHLLLEESVGPLEPKQVGLLLDAREDAERLLRLIEHLLALARLEQGRELLQVGPAPPASLLRNAADAVAARAQDRRITLDVKEADSLPPVAVDSMRLHLALLNLLDNALTYTEPGGKITLSAEQMDEGHVRLSVADTGVGIASEHLPHVFEKFFRVPENTQPTGTGLGLAIVKEIIAAHSGQVACVSELGKGTTFHLTLPIWKGGS